MDCPAFDLAAFHAALTTAAVGRSFEYHQSVPTTMVLARSAAARGAPQGTLVLAEEQTAGRGRRGRSFHSPPGENLYFTLVLRLPAQLHAALPLAVPLAVAEACRAEGLDARIKWPNDVWVDRRKLSGMLIDAETEGGAVIAYPGVGINVNGDPTRIPELAAIATSLRRALGRPVPRERLLARVCNGLEGALDLPAASLVAAYRKLSLVLGQPVTVTPIAGNPYEALAVDIAPDGGLVVRHPGGRQETLLAGEVSLRPAAPPASL